MTATCDLSNVHLSGIWQWYIY